MAVVRTARSGRRDDGDPPRIRPAPGSMRSPRATTARWRSRRAGSSAPATRKGIVKQGRRADDGARGLAFAPKGYRLAIAHYNGASFWFPNTASPAEAFEWKGSHLDVTISPDGRFLVTAMQESALHGWRIADHANMRMSGLSGEGPARSDGPSDGMWLATVGRRFLRDLAVSATRTGPMNKAPRECARAQGEGLESGLQTRRARCSRSVTRTAGCCFAGLPTPPRFSSRRPGCRPSRAVTALAWSADGTRLLYGTAGGEAGLVIVALERVDGRAAW